MEKPLREFTRVTWMNVVGRQVAYANSYEKLQTLPLSPTHLINIFISPVYGRTNTVHNTTVKKWNYNFNAKENKNNRDNDN